MREYAATISRFKKERFLRKLTEDEFRDRVIRPLFLLRGMTDGRDLCGPDEAGKDSIFVTENKLGLLDTYALQTKRGHLNLGRKESDSIVEATTQLRTALATSIRLLRPTPRRVVPNRAILCASGKINSSARTYILEHVDNPNISFLDSDELIPDIDDRMPELWFDIDANLFPYLRALKRAIEEGTQLFTRGELLAANLRPVAASESSFVSLRVYRFVLKRKNRAGRVEQVPDMVEIPITSILSSRDSRVILLGGAGSGKSTSLLRMAYLQCEKIESSDSPSAVPVFFRAVELTSPGESLLDAVITRTQEIGQTKKSPITSKDLSDGNLCIFIDALDELANLEVQRAIVSKLTNFSNQYPNCRVILTSRPYYTVEDIPGLAHFTEYTLCTMSYKEGQKILERLHKADSLPITKAGELLRQLQDVHGLELNPLIVTVFAASTDLSRSDIPANITELFKKFTELMLGRWDEGKGIESQFQGPLKDFVLTRLAYDMHNRRLTSIPLQEFKHFIAEELASRGHKANTEMLTDEILNRSGLFRIVNARVEFRHLMLQEFFAGRGLPNANNITTLVTDEWWRRALVFYFGDRPNEAAVLQRLCDGVGARKPREALTAATTIGLAVQASYLVKTVSKLPLSYWIFKTIADVTDAYDKDVIQKSERPLEAFINLVLYAREGVAFSFLKDHFNEIRREIIDSPDASSRIGEIRQFWFIIGLIEAGDLVGAMKELKKFEPNDRRLYLGLHLGAFLMHHKKVTTPSERADAKKICDSIQKEILDLRKQIMDEWKSEILEMQQGRVKALAAGSDKTS